MGLTTFARSILHLELGQENVLDVSNQPCCRRRHSDQTKTEQFALTEATYALIRLVQEFVAVENRDDMPWQEQLGITMTSAHGAKVGLVPRSKS